MDALQPVQDAPGTADESHSDRPYRGAKHITTAETLILLKLHDEGFTQTQIAQRLGKHQTAVSRKLTLLADDSAELAKRFLRNRSYKVARRVVSIAETGKDADSIAASKLVLTGAGVINVANNGLNVGVQVVIGPGVLGHTQPTTLSTVGIVEQPGRLESGHPVAPPSVHEGTE